MEAIAAVIEVGSEPPSVFEANPGNAELIYKASNIAFALAVRYSSDSIMRTLEAAPEISRLRVGAYARH